MDDNNLLMIILAFVFGFMLQGMMKNMCGGRLVEGSLFCGDGSKWCGFGFGCMKNDNEHLPASC